MDHQSAAVELQISARRLDRARAIQFSISRACVLIRGMSSKLFRHLVIPSAGSKRVRRRGGEAALGGYKIRGFIVAAEGRSGFRRAISVRETRGSTKFRLARFLRADIRDSGGGGRGRGGGEG